MSEGEDRPQKFWRLKQDWPDDALGREFLGRAVHRVGRALSPEWEGREPQARIYPPLPDYAEAEVVDHWRAAAILDGVDHYFERRPIYDYPEPAETLPGLYTLGLGAIRNDQPVFAGFRFFDREWKAAQEHVASRNERMRPVIDRLRMVQAWLKERALDGRLPFWTRERAGGEFQPAPAAWWNTEERYYAHRFDYCATNADRPFALSPRSWLFVERTALDTLLTPEMAPKPVTAATETRAIEALTKLLRADRNTTQAQARDALIRAGIPYTDRGLVQRILPAARMAAGLPIEGRRGRRSAANTDA